MSACFSTRQNCPGYGSITTACSTGDIIGLRRASIVSDPMSAQRRAYDSETRQRRGTRSDQKARRRKRWRSIHGRPDLRPRASHCFHDQEGTLFRKTAASVRAETYSMPPVLYKAGRPSTGLHSAYILARASPAHQPTPSCSRRKAVLRKVFSVQGRKQGPLMTSPRQLTSYS